tara:strand:- start:111774 stop:112832 length:1059 start_codon:yes stop_codon:yes gene_type:complete
MTNFLINTDKKLQKVVTNLNKSACIGLDTEFIRESSYYPILALIQLSNNRHTYCIDVLAIQNTNSIKQLLLNQNITKIIHSSKQDLEVLHSYFKCYPRNLFDTQIAASMTGYGLNVSYSEMVDELLNIKIKKGSWRTDWLKRPLSPEKIEYASNDVKYLIKIYVKLNKKLIKLKRTLWFKEEQNNDLERKNVITNPIDAWKKINYPLHLNNQELKKLKKLAECREIIAKEKNTPKRWIISDNCLTKLCQSTAKESDLFKSSKIDLKASEKELLIKSFRTINTHQSKRRQSNNHNIKNRINKYKKLLLDVSNKYNIPSSLIANKRDIEIFSKNHACVRFMRGWRFKIFGKLLQ